MRRFIFLSDPDDSGVETVLAYLLTENSPTVQERVRRLFGLCPDTETGDWPNVTEADLLPWEEVTTTELVGSDWRKFPDGSFRPPAYMEA